MDRKTFLKQKILKNMMNKKATLKLYDSSELRHGIWEKVIHKKNAYYDSIIGWISWFVLVDAYGATTDR